MTGDATIYKEYTSANLTCRFETLVNNLNFLTPEKFIEPVHFSVNIKRINEGVEKLTDSPGEIEPIFLNSYLQAETSL